MFVHEVIAAITTEPCLSSYSSPLKVNLDTAGILSAAISKPLKPTLLVRQLLKSAYILSR